VEEFQNPDGRYIVTFDGSIDGNLIQIAILVTENAAKKAESIRLFARPWPIVKLFRQFMERNLRPDPVPDAIWICQQLMRDHEELRSSHCATRPGTCKHDRPGGAGLSSSSTVRVSWFSLTPPQPQTLRRSRPPHTLSWREKSSAKCAMVLLNWPPPDHLWIGRNSCNVCDAPR
jgi:hypothetical protein